MQLPFRTLSASFAALIVVSLAAAPAAAETWSTPVVLQTETNESPFYLQVAGSASGAAAVAWFEQNFTDVDLWATVFEPASGWSGPTLLKTLPGFPDELQLEGDDAGNFFAVCLWSLAVEPDVLAARYAAGVGWSALSALESNDTHRAGDIALAVAGDGNAAVVYMLGNGTTYGVFEDVYVGGSGWGGPRTLFEGPAFVAAAVAAAAVGTGDLMAAWTVPNASYYDVEAAMYTAAGGFQAPSLVGTAVSLAEVMLLIAGSKTGEATVLWTNGGPYDDWWIRSFVPASGWLDIVDYYLAIEQISGIKVCADDGGVVHFAAFLGSSSPPLVTGRMAPGDFPAVDYRQIRTSFYDSTLTCFGNGRVIVSWYAEYAGDNYLWFSERAPSGAWSNAQLGGAGPSMGTAVPVGKGGALSVFSQFEGRILRAYASFLIPPDTEAPLLAVQVPLGGTHVTAGAVDVRGTTEPGADVTVNGMAAGVASNGSFSMRVPLLPGSNNIEVIARDAAGNAARTNLTVTFDDPLPGLLTNLTAAEADAAAARAQSAALAAQLVNASATANSTAGNLATAMARLSELQQQDVDIQARANATASDLVALQQENHELQAKVNATGTANPAPAGADPLVLVALLVAVAALAAAFIAPRMGKKSPP